MAQEPTVTNILVQLGKLSEKVENIDKKIDGHSTEMTRAFELFVTKEILKEKLENRDGKYATLNKKYNWIVAIDVLAIGTIISILLSFK